MKSPILIAEDAHMLREQMNLGNDDVIVDLISLIKESGFHYVEDHFADDFAGFSQCLGKHSYLIGYNLDRDWGIQFKRFTLAHELGHVSIPEHQYILYGKGALHRSFAKDQYNKDTELEADCFAANFLAPTQACFNLIPNMALTPENTTKLANHFNISTYAAALRIVDLTDEHCTIIVCNEGGKTEYEKRSPQLENALRFKCKYVHKTKIHEHTLAYEYIQGKMNTHTCESMMNYWYADLPTDLKAIESVIDLGYNRKFMVFLTPFCQDFIDFFTDDSE